MQFQKVGNRGRSGSDTEVTLVSEGGAQKKNPVDVVGAGRRCSKTDEQLENSERLIDFSLSTYEQEQYTQDPTHLWSMCPV